MVEGGNLLIEEAMVGGSRKAGLDIAFGVEAVVSDSIIRDSGNEGVRKSRANAHLARTAIVDNYSNGMVLRSFPSETEIVESLVAGTNQGFEKGTGIHVGAGNRLRIVDSSLIGNTRSGLAVMGGEVVGRRLLIHSTQPYEMSQGGRRSLGIGAEITDGSIFGEPPEDVHRVGRLVEDDAPAMGTPPDVALGR